MIKQASLASEMEDVARDLTCTGAVTSMSGPEERLLQDDELDAVSGGLVVIAIIAVLVGS